MQLDFFMLICNNNTIKKTFEETKMARRKQRSFLDGLDDFMIVTLLCCAIAGVLLLAFFFFKALLLSPYAVIDLTLLIGAFICFIIMLIVSVLSH